MKGCEFIGWRNRLLARPFVETFEHFGVNADVKRAGRSVFQHGKKVALNGTFTGDGKSGPS